ncbi:MAG: aldo/keto reductase [Vicinamibacterales bacterium]
MSPGIPRIDLASGYSISRLLKGGWQLAGGHGAIDRSVALDDMDRFVEAGITTFDCADIYTGVEALIGELIRERSAKDRIQVHTKYVPDLGTLRTVNKAGVEAAIDRSRSRLGVERLDLVQLHWWDYDIPRYVDVARWLDECRRAGQIAHLGVTNFDVPRLREIIDAGVPVRSHQVQYSVLDRRPASGMAALCEATGIRLLCYGGLCGGFLSERYLGHPPPTPPLDNRSLVKYRLIIEEFGGWERFQRMLRVLHDIAGRHGVTIGVVALRWLLDRPHVAGVIVGARHSGHLIDLQRVPALVLTEQDRIQIAEVHVGAPGPSGDVYDLERIKGGTHASIMRYTVNTG